MQGWGIGFVGEGHPKDKFVFFKGEGMFGWGDIQLTEGESLMDILETSGSDWKVGCLNIGGTIGIEYDWLKSERMDLYTAAFAGAAYYHFWLYAEGSDGTEGLTSDLRLHTGAEVRSSF